jgi:hypothetical protein
MAGPPNGLPPQQQPLSPTSPQERARWVTFATWGGILLLVYLLGPVIFIARRTQVEAGARAWHAEERWSRVRGSALLSLLCYLPVLVFAPALAGFWTSLFGGLANWSRLPFIRELGGTAFWLPIPSSLLLRWVLALPLTSCIALLLEALQPRTGWEEKRVLSPDEQAHLVAEQAAEEKKRQAALARRSRVQPTASKKPGSTRRQSRPSSDSATPSATPVAKQTASLWNQIDWSQVPDDDPLKKAALEEAERQAAARRNAERTQWVLDQMARQETASPPASGSTGVSPTPPVQAPPSYNWDEGEGTVRDS